MFKTSEFQEVGGGSVMTIKDREGGKRERQGEREKERETVLLLIICVIDFSHAH